MEPITWFLTGMQKHSDDFREDLLGNSDSFLGAMRHHMVHFSGPSLDVAMNELSNHDHSRFLTRTNQMIGRVDMLGPEAATKNVDLAVMRLAVMMQMTWLGAPTIYYGDEVGLCGFTDPDNRRSYPWGKEDIDLFNFHKHMIEIRKYHKVLQTGSIRYMEGDFNYLAYARFNQEEVFIIAVNNNKYSYEVNMDVHFLGVTDGLSMKRLMFTHQTGYATEPANVMVINGKLNFELPAQSGVLLKTNISEKNKQKNFLQFL
jgi:alpha-glucosidase